MLTLRDALLVTLGPPIAAAFAVGAFREVARARTLFNSFVYIFIFIAGIPCYGTRYYSTTFLSRCRGKVHAVHAPAGLPRLPALLDAGPLNPPREDESINGNLSLPRAHIARHGKGLVAHGALVLPEAAREPVEA